ncbi:MAG: glycosyltransferase family 4 protein [Tannerella sp.]|jgi:glycosyltransferase involved in cell wall biosynthesis|nr:glycosyltransferase family 4 protein [Tannerella sp.]
MKVIVTGLRGFPNIQGGIETHCEELYPRLVALGCDVTVLRRKPFVKEAPPLSSYNGVKFKDIATFRKMGVEVVVHTFLSVWYAFRSKADVLHIHAIGPSITVPLAKMLGLKVVVTHHGPDYNRRKWGRFARFILKTGEYFAARWADEIIVISTTIRQLLQDNYHRERAHLIYNGVKKFVGVESTGYVSSLGLTPEKYILAVGRFVEEKNFDALILAFSGATLPSGYKLVIAGDADHPTAYSETLKKSARDHQVVLTGMIKGQPLQELYTHAGLFVLPSSHEGLPITLLEAMSYEIDVLVSDIPANSAVELPPDCYFHYGGDIPANLCKALEAKIRNRKVHSYDLTPYDWDTIAEKTMAVYRIMT